LTTTLATVPTATPQIALVCDAARVDRYADRYETQAGIVDVRPLSAVDQDTLALVVVDTPVAPDPKLWAGVAVPVLIAPDLLLSSGFAASLPADLDWAPLAPWPYGADVQMGRGLVAAGRVGPIRQGHIATGIGIPAHPGWETDEWWACSSREAVFGAASAGERLLGARWTGTQLLVRSSTMLLLLHTFEGGAVLTQTVAASSATGLPWLSITLIGESGRLSVNQEFAPGNVGLWDTAAAGFAFPAVSLPKPNVQAADSVRGGWELVTLLTSMLSNDSASRSDVRVAAVRLAEKLTPLQL
jgi:hypothetical protein